MKTLSEVREAAIAPARKLRPIDEGVCTVSKPVWQSNGALLIQGNILAPTEVYVGGDLLVGQDGTILCAGADCSSFPEASGATRIVCPDGVVSPGLINPHDHLVFDHFLPADWGDERFDHRHDWRRGLRHHTRIDCDRDPDNNRYCRLNETQSAIAWTELRQLMSGTTSIADDARSDTAFPGLARKVNWDMGSGDGLEAGRVELDTFPYNDKYPDSVEDLVETGCNYPIFDDEDSSLAEVQASVQVNLDDGRYSVHLAEGVDRVAHNEFLCFTGQQRGAVTGVHPDTSLVHATAVRAPGAQILKDTGTSVIWSPRSNIALYGATAPVTLFANVGIWQIALSTDWTATGSMNLLQELECARYYNDEHLAGYFSDYELWRMVTVNAAVALNLEDQIGMLEPGLFADIAIFAGDGGSDHHRAVIYAGPKDVVLVLKSGIAQYGDQEIMRDLRSPGMSCEGIRGGVCGREKIVCMPESSAVSLAELAESNAGSLPLFYCDEPRHEPSCVPMRHADEWGCGQYPLADPSQDADGDGVLDRDDNCPVIFNPVLPLDGYYSDNPEACQQADYDGDGVGDACDRDPLRK